jgi:hypothetical protein
MPSTSGSDNPMVQHAGHRNFEKLLKCGVRLFEYPRHAVAPESDDGRRACGARSAQPISTTGRLKSTTRSRWVSRTLQLAQSTGRDLREGMPAGSQEIKLERLAQAWLRTSTDRQRLLRVQRTALNDEGSVGVRGWRGANLAYVSLIKALTKPKEMPFPTPLVDYYPWLMVSLAGAVAVTLALVAHYLLVRLARRLARPSILASTIVEHAERPARLVLPLFALQFVIAGGTIRSAVREARGDDPLAASDRGAHVAGDASDHRRWEKR